MTKTQRESLAFGTPESTFPIFFNGQVIGTAAIAGEPEIVLQFSTLLKNQIESMLGKRYTPIASIIPK